MDLLWIPVLGSLMLVEILWTLPIDKDQQRLEDVELAEVCEWMKGLQTLCKNHINLNCCFS